MKRGFSLAEMLVTLIVIGVICSVSIPLVKDSLNDHGPLFKSAYNTVSSVAFTFVQSTALYPDAMLNNTGNSFCTNFFETMNVIGETNCGTTASVIVNGNLSTSVTNAITTNGMRWYGFDGDFNQACPITSATNCMMISVDINGEDGKNTHDYTSSYRDIYDMYITPDGNVVVEDLFVDQDAAHLPNTDVSLEHQYLQEI